MEPHSFWAELFQTYLLLPDSIKALWVITPPLFVLALVALLRFPARKTARRDPHAEPPFTTYETGGQTLVRLPLNPRDRSGTKALSKNKHFTTVEDAGGRG